MKTKQITEALNYGITKKGVVINLETKKIVAPDQNGNVKLTVLNDEGTGTEELNFNTQKLVETYYPKTEKKETNKRDPERLNKVKKLFEEGKTRKEIRETLGLKSVGSYIRKITGGKTK